MNEPRYRLVHEWVVGGWWLSDLTLLARAGAGDRTQVLLMTLLAQHNTYVCDDQHDHLVLIS